MNWQRFLNFLDELDFYDVLHILVLIAIGWSIVEAIIATVQGG